MATTYPRPAGQARTASGLNMLLGIWLILSPWALAFSAIESAVWNCVIVGLAIAIFALMRVASPFRNTGLSWINFALGIWLVLSPFLLNYGDVDNAMWNTVIVGLLVLALSAWSAASSSPTPDAPGPPTGPTDPIDRPDGIDRPGV